MPDDRLQKLLQLHTADPADADVPYMIAMEHAKGEHPEDALPWLDKAIDLRPDYLYAYYQKGQLQAQLGDRDAAVATLKIGLERATATGNQKAISELTELLATVSAGA